MLNVNDNVIQSSNTGQNIYLITVIAMIFFFFSVSKIGHNFYVPVNGRKWDRTSIPTPSNKLVIMSIVLNILPIMYLSQCNSFSENIRCNECFFNILYHVFLTYTSVQVITRLQNVSLWKLLMFWFIYQWTYTYVPLTWLVCIIVGVQVHYCRCTSTLL